MPSTMPSVKLNTSSESFTDLPGFEGRYQIARDGTLRSVGRFVPHKSGGRRWINSRILETREANECKIISLSSDTKKGITTTVARLVLMTFDRFPEDGEWAHHKDGNMLNCHIDNLEWRRKK